MNSVIEKTRDPAIFDHIRKLDARLVIPALTDGAGRLHTIHPEMSDLITKHLRPGNPVIWVDQPIDFDADINRLLDDALTASPTNTSPGMDDIGYPFLRFWAKKYRDSLTRLVAYSLRHDIEDWHMAHTILIPMADKPVSNIAKSWQMIHLLPTLAKVVEQMVLSQLADDVELEESQFGSRKKQGCRDSMAIAYEFLEHNHHMSCAMLSMDIEGGFDHVNIGTLRDIMIGRGANPNTVKWVVRSASARHVRFHFNPRMSRTYHTSLGIPQGSPLSPFLFGICIVDFFRPRLKYTPTVRYFVSSYVDDGLVLVAADSREMAVWQLKELFVDCNRVARGRGIGFAPLKTNWIGFGEGDWEELRIGTDIVRQVPDLRVPGFSFNVSRNWSADVGYWLERGMDVRRRIAALVRRFGGGGIGAWEVFCLIQAAYIPTVCYGLEFVTGYTPYVKRIQTHVKTVSVICIRCR